MSASTLAAEKRRHHFVDSRVQGALLRQVTYSCLWAVATCAFIVFVYRVVPERLSGSSFEPSRVWYHMAPYVVTSAVLFPFAVFSAIRFSHRFAGPMIRVRRTLNQLAQGETPPKVVFRNNDFWSDIADDINEIAALLRQEQVSNSAAPDIETHSVSSKAGAETLEATAEL